MMPNPTNEPGPADGDKKIEEKTAKSYDDMYSELLRKDQEKLEKLMTERSTQDFDSVRKLGFVTNKDVDSKIEAIFGKFVSEVQTLRDENTKLREWVMRAKAQGLNSGATEEDRREESALKSWERPFKFEPRRH